MKVTAADLSFWQVKHTPRFAQDLLKKNAARMWPNISGSIHACVNAHAGHKTSDAELSAGNLLSILRSMRRRKEGLRAELARIAACPGTIIRPERRAAYALKWIAKMGYFQV